MRALFIDTGFFCALANRQDSWNSPATSLIKQKVLERYRLYTSNAVLYETYTLIRSRVHHAAAVSFMSNFPRSGVSVFRITEAIEQQAKKIFIRYEDKNFSFVDCTSFAVVDYLRCETVLTFDHHFRLYRYKHAVAVLP